MNKPATPSPLVISPLVVLPLLTVPEPLIVPGAPINSCILDLEVLLDIFVCEVELFEFRDECDSIELELMDLVMEVEEGEFDTMVGREIEGEEILS